MALLPSSPNWKQGDQMSLWNSRPIHFSWWLIHNFTAEKVDQFCATFVIFTKTTHSQQPPNRRKFAQSGHPDWKGHLTGWRWRRRRGGSWRRRRPAGTRSWGASSSSGANLINQIRLRFTDNCSYMQTRLWAKIFTALVCRYFNLLHSPHFSNYFFCTECLVDFFTKF
jgi:hypothetical protein